MYMTQLIQLEGAITFKLGIVRGRRVNSEVKVTKYNFMQIILAANFI